MFLSKRCLHGLRAMLYLVVQPEDRSYVPIGEIAEQLGMPFHFLTKILQDLTREGMLQSARGVTGGVRLAVPPEDLDVLQIIETLEGENFFRGCVLGFTQCSGKNPCALHEQWKTVREELIHMFSGENLATIAARIEEDSLRIFETSPTP